MTMSSHHEIVFDVPREEQQAYCRSSYAEYLRAWNARVEELEGARRAEDLERAARLAEELRHVWPQPGDVARAAWAPAGQRPLSSDAGL
jgi:hypothetical protein